MFDVDAEFLHFCNFSCSNIETFIGTVVEHLYLQFAGRVFKLTNGFNQAFNHVELIENGQLYGYHRPLIVGQLGFALLSLLELGVFDSQIELHQAVDEKEHQETAV